MLKKLWGGFSCFAVEIGTVLILGSVVCCRVPHLLLQVTSVHRGLQLGGHHLPRFGVKVKELNLPALGYGLKQRGMCFGELLVPHSAPQRQCPPQ